MRKLTIMIALAVSVALGGCGSSGRTHAQMEACWRAHDAAFAQRYAQEVVSFSGKPPSGQLVLATTRLVTSLASEYEFAKLDPSQTTPEITKDLKATQARCGRLKR